MRAWHPFSWHRAIEYHLCHGNDDLANCEMSDDFDRRQLRFPESRYFEDLALGERFHIPAAP